MPKRSLSNGRFRFDLSYRDFRGDEGLSISIKGPVKEENKELIRFDCFEKTPHYHIGVHDQNEITAISTENPVEIAFTHLTSEFQDLVKSSGGDALNDNEISTFQSFILGLRQEADEVIQTSKMD